MDEVNVLSLGAGVQSSALLLLYNEGKLKPRPDFAIFADTKAEPKKVYTWLNILIKKVDIPVHIFSKGNIDADARKPKKGFASIPFFIKNDDGTQGLGRRQCTREYKIEVVVQGIRRILGYEPRKRMKHKINVLLGISTDEAQRMRDNRLNWATNVYPLINELSWNRSQCFNYVKDVLGVPPKSACYLCPYRNNESWQQMKELDPESFEKACSFDDYIRTRSKFEGQAFLHRSMVPLRDIDFKKLRPNPPLFGEDCEGMCGV